MFDFLKKFFGDDGGRDSQLEAEIVGAVESLDLQTAIFAHENWKLRLQAYLEGSSSESFAAEEICFDDRCDLGKWIHGSGQARLGKFPGFTALMGHHKMFHYAASNVVALSKAGKEAEAHGMLNGQFSMFSKEVVDDLGMLQRLVERAAAKASKHH